MRGLFRLMVGTAIVFAAVPASAQRYDPTYPVCMEQYGADGSVINCFFTTMEQCKSGAGGTAGLCFPNPYYKPPAAPAVEAAPEPVHAPAPPPVKKKKKAAAPTQPPATAPAAR